MPTDPYVILRALLRAEAARSAPKQDAKTPQPKRPQEERGR
ncbi:hypothetical protein ACFV29_33470 [Streptomyces sp. NPDC059690]